MIDSMADEEELAEVRIAAALVVVDRDTTGPVETVVDSIVIVQA